MVRWEKIKVRLAVLEKAFLNFEIVSTNPLLCSLHIHFRQFLSDLLRVPVRPELCLTQWRNSWCPESRRFVWRRCTKSSM